MNCLRVYLRLHQKKLVGVYLTLPGDGYTLHGTCHQIVTTPFTKEIPPYDKKSHEVSNITHFLFVSEVSVSISIRYECHQLGSSLWSHQFETFSALLALNAGNRRWIPLTKASDAESWCFLWFAPWINGWVNNSEAGDLRRHRAHYDVTNVVLSMRIFWEPDGSTTRFKVIQQRTVW